MEVKLTDGLIRAVRHAKYLGRKYWSVKELTDGIKVSPRAARSYVQTLCTAGLLERAFTYPPTYRYTRKFKLSKKWEPLLGVIQEES